MTKPRKLAVWIGVAAGVCGLLSVATTGPLSWLLTWASVSCAFASRAYVLNAPGMYGKRDGRLVWWRALPSGVFLGAFRIACGLMRRARRHPTKSEVVPRLWVAGRVEKADLPPNLNFVIDLVAEFPEPPAVREFGGYRSLPVLDGGIPASNASVLDLLEEVADPSANVLVHCDSGMGRAPTFAALLLLRRGQATDLADAVDKIERARPFIHLGSADRAFLAQIEPQVPRPLHDARRAAVGGS